ncbi:MAG: adenine phosphoribosyltransferase [Fibrobacterota bacterium]
MDLYSKIRDIKDFPKEGIVFKDITTLLKDPEALKHTIDSMAGKFADKKIDVVVGAESRGFIFGAAVACKLGAGFVPARKPGKLPHDTISESYELEYGTDAIEMHKDAIEKGQNVLIVDDLIATGGTVKAVCGLVEKLGGNISGVVFLIELAFLKGRDKINGYTIESLMTYAGE